MDTCTTANRKKQLYVNISQICKICNSIFNYKYKSGPSHIQLHARKVRFITAEKQTTEKTYIELVV